MSADQPAPRDPQAWRSWPAPPGIPDRALLDLLTMDAAGPAMPIREDEPAQFVLGDAGELCRRARVRRR